MNVRRSGHSLAIAGSLNSVLCKAGHLPETETGGNAASMVDLSSPGDLVVLCMARTRVDF